MSKNFRAIKISLIMGILLVSLLFVFVPSSSAGILPLDSYVEVSHDPKAASAVITPVETTLTIPIYISYEVLGPLAALPKIPDYLGETAKAIIDIEIDSSSVPSFASASLDSNTVQAEISSTLTEVAKPVLLYVSVNDDAPGFIDFVITVKAHANVVNGLLVKVRESDAETEVRVKPSYAALISIEAPKGNYMEIGPADTADFQISVENLGNAPTEVIFEVLDFPEGWSPNIQEYMILGSGVDGENTEKTVTLRIKPPYGFGYHDELETIRVKITPSYQRNPSLVGRVYTFNFQIHNRGFSSPPFESAVVVTAIVLIGVFVFYLMKRRNK